MASWDTKLLTAAEKGNIKEVELCVKNGANLECSDYFGRTPLMMAAGEGHLEVLTYLITHSSQLDSTNEGKTPYDLVLISKYHSEEKKKEVMDFLKNVMSKTSPEVTPDTHLQEPEAPVVEDKIRDNADRIIQNIQISQILDHMMTHLVISVDDRRCIEQHSEQDDQNKALLDIVIKRKEPVYSVFVDGLLNYGYEDIANDLNCDTQETSPSTTLVSAENEGLSDWNVPLYKVRIQKNYLKIITDIQHENIVDHLISREVLSVDDGKKIESGKTPQEKNRTLIDMLLCKKEQGFFEFLKALRKDHVYADLADLIEKTLVTSTDISILHKCLK